ncbi:MAG: hypothetical protein HUJ65_00255, partial [Oscillospiraceae bacterium]|nr:hypothetical protein [Oscillospiraceae bacterium]
MDNVFERLQDSLSNVLSYLEIALTTIRFVDIIDILIVAYVIYKVLTFVRRTSSGRVIRGIIFLVVVLYLSSFLHLNVISFLLGQTMELGILVVIVLITVVENIRRKKMRTTYVAETYLFNDSTGITKLKPDEKP